MLDKRSKIVFSRFIFTIYDMGIQRVPRDYRGLKGVTRGYRGLQVATRGDKGLERIKANLFLTRRLPDTFSGCILHKTKRSQNFKFLTKTMD